MSLEYLGNLGSIERPVLKRALPYVPFVVFKVLFYEEVFIFILDLEINVTRIQVIDFILISLTFSLPQLGNLTS
jgi:hypothetical protein